MSQSKMLLDILLANDPGLGREVLEAFAAKCNDHIVPGSSREVVCDVLAFLASMRIVENLLWDRLATSILVKWINANTPKTFTDAIKKMHAHYDETRRENVPLVTDEMLRIANGPHAVLIDLTIRSEEETIAQFKYMGVKTLLKNYLMRSTDERLMENIEQMYARVAFGVNGETEIKDAIDMYRMLSTHKVSHASPTMFYAGTPKGQLQSCFLLKPPAVKKLMPHGKDDDVGDSIESFFELNKQVAIISKGAGGVGFSVSMVRARGSPIGEGGVSDGIVPLLRCFESTAKYVDQGKNKRPGAFAVYLEPWHGDTFEFLDLKKGSGDDEQRTRDLHLALWLPDLFIDRVENKGKWSLMCPKMCPGLDNVYGDTFKELYERYETEGRYIRQVDAEQLWDAIVTSIKETGEPYLLFKDTANASSNQKNLGTIKLSNLCVSTTTQIMTRKGPAMIGACVPGNKVEAHKIEVYDKMEARLRVLSKLVEDGNKEYEVEHKEFEKRIKMVGDRPEELITPCEIDVWNGNEFLTVVPFGTAKDYEFMTVVTSHGQQLCCTHDHTFYLEDGVTQVKASDLKLGDRLEYAEPVVYDDEDQPFISEPTTFMAGMVYGYILKKEGVHMAAGIGQNFKLEEVMVRRSTVADKQLAEMFAAIGYDEEKVRTNTKYEEFDHDELMIIPVPDNLQSLRSPVMARLVERKAWVAGFVVGIEGDFSKTMCGDISVIQRVVDMFRSVGEHVKLDPADGGRKRVIAIVGGEKGRDDPKARAKDPPRVIMLSQTGDKDDMYCVNVPKTHKAIFNGIMTGNCSEIFEYTSTDEIACCNLSAIVLPSYVKYDTDGKPYFDFDELHANVAKDLIFMDRVIDRNNYMLPQMETSNLRNRPIGMGTIGLSDVFNLLGYPWQITDPATGKVSPHPEMRKLHARIFETIYHAGIVTSIERAASEGSYASFEGSPLSKGFFRFDMIDSREVPLHYKDWAVLREKVKKGARWSLMFAQMPTATTGKIVGCSEGCDPFYRNTFVQSGLAGEFIEANRSLIKDLTEEGLWTSKLKEDITANNGSVIGLIPEEYAERYRTAFEISLQVQIRLQADRQAFIDQGQSFNWHLNKATSKALWRALKYSHSLGNVNAVYYTRTQPSTDPQKLSQSKAVTKEWPTTCYLASGPDCEACAM